MNIRFHIVLKKGGVLSSKVYKVEGPLYINNMIDNMTQEYWVKMSTDYGKVVVPRSSILYIHYKESSPEQ